MTNEMLVMMKNKPVKGTSGLHTAISFAWSFGCVIVYSLLPFGLVSMGLAVLLHK